VTYRDPLKSFGYSLDRYESSLELLSYAGALKAPVPDWRQQFVLSNFPQGAIAGGVTKFTTNAVGPPHGFELLRPVPIPEFPKFPPRPSETMDSYTIKQRVEELERKSQKLRQQFETQFQKEATELEGLRRSCAANDPAAIRLLMVISHLRHQLPAALQLSFETEIDPAAHVALCTIEIPDFASLKVVKPRGAYWTNVSAAEKKRTTEAILYCQCLRAAYLVAKSDEGNWFDIVAINAKQSWFDAATGAQRTGIIASLQATKAELVQLHLEQVDPKTCFRHLKGISTPSVEQVSPVRPIFILNKEDSRIVRDRDIAQELQPEANLAAMPWEDFEHLVRQLFEWEFGRNGVEVKVTRASRDRGVDAIMFDPDPLRGGKYVLQAKRYTRTVDVAAVRDLYGTVVNEGANRGILVTTSSYGPDSYDFAKDKPLSLVDGPNLIAMLKRHGRNYRIDLVEARRLAADDHASR
jgi:restriction system protein